MKRILGLDLGTKTLGLCISDVLMITVNPIENFYFEENNFDLAIEKISLILRKYKNENKIGTIVLGYPLRMSGTKSNFTLVVERFYEQLKRKFPKIKIVLEDERETTKSAYKIMKEQNIKSKSKKQNIDKISSCIILKNYLDRLK